ncbi:LytTR family transcriptional regulator DNA-binding domain-containing protein [uncultured Brevundimonas sp.]|uniref:LytR/AlgR family response regulator transcription factor n=1 Tax=uncultured Brevundimonas sp. TaxID=213418 RepID=UPI0030EF3028|tara:strand:+ start:78885 stop:80318 length:1434 start_codon:yes stop_codon:yes gene_type:complete
MWRILIIVGLLMGLASLARAAEPAWQTCRGTAGPDGPILSDCRPLTGVIDPQGRDLWLRTTVPAPDDNRPRALHVIGIASSEAWLNGRSLGANGRPAATAQAEVPGRYEAALPIGETAWRAGENALVVHLSSFHGGLRLDQPMGGVVVAPYPLPARTPLLAITLVAAGALLAAAFGFGVIHAMRRTVSSLILAAIAAVAALQAVAESLRPLFGYAYPLHVWRLGAIWLLAAAFAVLLVSFVAGRFMPGARRPMIALAVIAAAATTVLPGFDGKTGWALLSGVILAIIAAGMGVWQRQPGARPILAWLALFMTLALAFPDWLVDLSYFLLAASLVLPLLMVEVVRLSREDRGREAALTRAADRPNRLTVASARGVELVPIPDILAVVGAGDYVELRLVGGRQLLHTARLERLADQLPPGFQRIHRSVIVNLAQVRRLDRDGDRWRVQMLEGPPLPVSRSRLSALRDALDDDGLSRPPD